MSSGETSWPDCTKPSPRPYIFSICGHSLPVTCLNLDRFTSDPSLAKCQEEEHYEPGCGHSKPMKCWKREEFESGAMMYLCGRKQQVVLPRCGHEQSLACNTAQSLNSWTGTSCDEVGVVSEGTLYGSKDADCKEQITLIRKCGHKMRLPCNEAFLRAHSLGPCRELVATHHPVCGHPCSAPCRYISGIDKNAVTPEELSEIKEGEFQRTGAVPTGMPKCNSSVKFIRKCGHTENMKCWSKSLYSWWHRELFDLARRSPFTTNLFTYFLFILVFNRSSKSSSGMP